jgi:hypothetical protein
MVVEYIQWNVGEVEAETWREIITKLCRGGMRWSDRPRVF